MAYTQKYPYYVVFKYFIEFYCNNNYYGSYAKTFKQEYTEFINEVKELIPDFQLAWESIGTKNVLVIFVPSEEDATLLKLKYGKYIQYSPARF